MSEGVRRHSFRQAGGLAQAAEHPSDLARGDRLVTFPGEERRISFDREAALLIELQELGDNGLRRWVEGHDPRPPDSVLAFGDGRGNEEFWLGPSFVGGVLDDEPSHPSDAKAFQGFDVSRNLFWDKIFGKVVLTTSEVV